MPTLWYTDTPAAANYANATYTYMTGSTSADGIWQLWMTNATSTSASNTVTMAPIQNGLGGLLSNATPFTEPPPEWWREREQEAQEQQAQRLRRFQAEDLARRNALEAECAADPLGLRRTKEQRRLDAAKAKAIGILCDHLSNSQIASLVKYDYFLVQGGHSGKTYRIELGYARNVKLIAINGKPVTSYCAHPANAFEMPDCDSMLMQLLMLKYSEQEFLKIANTHHHDAEVLRAA